MVSYNDCEAQHSGDGVILLVDDDAQLSAIFISDMRGEFEPYFAVLEIKKARDSQLASRVSIQQILQVRINNILLLYMFQALHRLFKLFQRIDIRREINFWRPCSVCLLAVKT